jgi:tol-pal system protein YbgF
MNAVRFARLLMPVASLATGACFATRNDVRILQSDVLAVRQEAARADSARTREIAALTALLTAVNDTLRSTSATMNRFAGDVRGELRSVDEQLVQMQALLGQSQAVLARIRAEAEQRALQMAAPMPAVVTPPATVTGDSSAAVPPAVQPGTPGPNLMFQEGLAQFRRGSYGAAQTVFEDLLRLHPAADVAPDALYYLAESYDAGGTAARADTAFLAVASRFPKSPRASSSLYKMGLSLAKRGSRAEARLAMDRVVKEYPSSDEAVFAREWLAANK